MCTHRQHASTSTMPKTTAGNSTFTKMQEGIKSIDRMIKNPKFSAETRIEFGLFKFSVHNFRIRFRREIRRGRAPVAPAVAPAIAGLPVAAPVAVPVVAQPLGVAGAAPVAVPIAEEHGAEHGEEHGEEHGDGSMEEDLGELLAEEDEYFDDDSTLLLSPLTHSSLRDDDIDDVSSVELPIVEEDSDADTYIMGGDGEKIARLRDIPDFDPSLQSVGAGCS